MGSFALIHPFDFPFNDFQMEKVCFSWKIFPTHGSMPNLTTTELDRI
jgi:hypothetical protein